MTDIFSLVFIIFKPNSDAGCHVSIHSFSNLTSTSLTSHVPGIVLGAGDTAGNKVDYVAFTMGLPFQVSETETDTVQMSE